MTTPAQLLELEVESELKAELALGSDSESKSGTEPGAKSEPKKQLTFTAEDVRCQYEQGMLTETGRDYMLMRLGVSAEAHRDALFRSIFRRHAGDEITAKGAKEALGRLGYSDLVTDQFPEYIAHPPTRSRRWWRLTTSDFWAAMLRQGEINVVVLDDKNHLLGRKDQQIRGPKVKHADGTGLDFEKLVKEGELLEINGTLYRYIGTTSSAYAEPLCGGDREGTLDSLFYADRVTRATGRFRAEKNEYAALGAFKIDGFNLKFTARIRRKPVRHIPDVLIDLANSDPEVRKKSFASRCWFTQFRGIVVEPFLEEQEDVEETDES